MAPIKIIPPEGVDDPEKLHSREGICFLPPCTGQQEAHLRRHYKGFHRGSNELPPGTIKEIPFDGVIAKLSDIYTGKGTCRVQGCDTEIAALQRHYEQVHLKSTKQCPTCEKNVITVYFSRHQLIHSGPVKCSACGVQSVSLLAGGDHRKFYHKRCSDVTSILLDEEEAEAFRLEKEAARTRTMMRMLGWDRIVNIKTKLDQYEIHLETDGHKLQQRAAIIRDKVQFFFTLPPAPMMCYNASYATMWDPLNKIPKLVLECVEKKQHLVFHSGDRFYADPKIPKHCQPVNDDYKWSGYDRGHLSASANHGEELLAAATYYYANAMPMAPNFNQMIRSQLEGLIRKYAKDGDNEVIAVHFPSGKHPLGRITKIGNGVLVPPYIATVIIITKKNGQRQIYGYELFNDKSDLIYAWKECICDPFALMEAAGLHFNLTREDFHHVSRSIVVTERPSSSS